MSGGIAVGFCFCLLDGNVSPEMIQAVVCILMVHEKLAYMRSVLPLYSWVERNDWVASSVDSGDTDVALKDTIDLADLSLANLSGQNSTC